jgi:hypothetical protein
MTTIPEIAPVAMPMFALGQRDHQRRIVASLVVASLTPFLVRGCLPRLPQSG